MICLSKFGLILIDLFYTSVKLLKERWTILIQKRYGRRKKVCMLCTDKIDNLDFKEVSKLRKYISDRGKILPRRTTGACAKHQRVVTTAIKRARHLALMPYVAD